MSLYLLHFDKPLGDSSRPRMSARHYLGWAPDGQEERRINLHLQGRGAAITRAAVAQGIQIHVVAIVPGDRNEERRRKRAGHHDRRCSFCNP